MDPPAGLCPGTRSRDNPPDMVCSELSERRLAGKFELRESSEERCRWGSATGAGTGAGRVGCSGLRDGGRDVYRFDSSKLNPFRTAT